MNGYPLEQIRANYPALEELCYLNTGTVGLMSESTLAAHLDRIAEYERFGHARESNARAAYERARATFASLIGASVDEIAMTRNASDGVNLVLSGLEIPPGKSILATTEEHPAVLLPANIAANNASGNLVLLDLDSDDEALIEQLHTALRANDIHVAIISHISCETGRRLPIVEMCRICREAGVLTLVDGAQSIGQIEVRVSGIGCDYMTGNGHKWLCGPKGTGFLYIKRERIEDLTPRSVGDGSVEPRFDRSMFGHEDGALRFGFRADAQRFEFGTRNWHTFGSVTDAVTTLEELGWSNVFAHVAAMSDYLKDELRQRPGVTLQTPAGWSDSCGIVTFSVDGWDGVELSNRLWEGFNVIQRRVQTPSGVRVSCAHYTSQDDIDRFLSALDATM